MDADVLPRSIVDPAWITDVTVTLYLMFGSTLENVALRTSLLMSTLVVHTGARVTMNCTQRTQSTRSTTTWVHNDAWELCGDRSHVNGARAG
jgi:steroid 5-alpha reductase family enzyme